VAGFIGTPAMNFLRVKLHTENGNTHLDAPWLIRKLDAALHVQHEQDIVMGIRPHDIRLADSENADAHALIEAVNPLGRELAIQTSLIGKTDSGLITVVLPADFPVERHQPISLAFAREKIHIFDPVSERRLN
jgi:ABC-type sugar transport system ATPase subunit